MAFEYGTCNGCCMFSDKLTWSGDKRFCLGCRAARGLSKGLSVACDQQRAKGLSFSVSAAGESWRPICGTGSEIQYAEQIIESFRGHYGSIAREIYLQAMAERANEAEARQAAEELKTEELKTEEPGQSEEEGARDLIKEHRQWMDAKTDWPFDSKDQLSEIHLDLLTTTDELRDRQDRIERMLEGVLVSMGFVFVVLAVVALSVVGGGR